MIDWIKHLTQLGNLLVFYLECLTFLKCFGIGDYNHMSMVKKLLW